MGGMLLLSFFNFILPYSLLYFEVDVWREGNPMFGFDSKKSFQQFSM